MFSEKINKNELSQVASEFKSLLVKYSDSYIEAKNILSRASSLINKAINRDIDAPYRRGFLPEEFWESGALFEVDDLAEKCSQFSLLLKGAKSIEAVVEGVRKIEKQAEIDEREFRAKHT
ncbi:MULTISPECIES: hypothetical protein [unclassified Microbulbifer]|uniref:hypothetical protein n=1 Tax=unclassified Microbulbifer TaxID=2619833 RepID=UPI001E436820|nr:hypothetical protein [Microbulbifer sp. YPW16]UHQ54975.1 hypothetical protein LVE68_15925 [Microbulbifer sp. YPW16]